jgi:uncharacterized membrane protein YhiD involved in acid resistance
MGAWEPALNLALAAVLGGLIGLERELRGQPAGLRTHMVLSIGAGLAALLSVLFSRELSAPGHPSDPARIVAQVVSGLGFLGAGAIVRYGASIKGLTTAASLWTTAVVGIACGAGFWAAAGLTTGLTLTTLWAVGHVERRWLSSYRTHTLKVTVEDRPGVVRDLRRALEGLGARVASTSASLDGSSLVKVTLIIHKPAGLTVDKIIGVARREFTARSVRLE